MNSIDTDIPWDDIGDLMCSILVKVKENQVLFEKQAARRGISVEQLIAAAITEAIREKIETS